MALPQDETTTEQPSIDYEALGLEPVSDEELLGFGLQTEEPETPKAETPEIDYEALGLEPVGDKELFGFEIPKEEPQPSESFLRPVADPLLNIGAGINDVVKGFTDAFGADNAVSQNLAKNSEWYRSLLSAGAKQDQEEIGRIMQEADGQGVLAEIGAGLKALSVAPVDLVAQGIGSLIPFIATAGLGKAAGLSKAGIAVLQGVQGGVVGGGIVKGEIYSAVKDQLINSGVDEAKAEKAANEAQAYNGKNLDQILLGVGLGVAASSTGADSAIRNLISRKVGKEAAEQVSEQAIQEVLRTGFVRGAVKDGIVEAATEGLQGGQERLAANVAVGREGFGVEPMRGVFGQATLEGALGGIIGGGAGGISAKVEQMDARKKVALRDALKAAEEAKQSNAPASAAVVEEQINQTIEETPDEAVARLQREAQEAAGEIELEEELPVSGLPPVEPTPPVTPTPEAAVAPVEPVVPAEEVAQPPTPEAAPTPEIAQAAQTRITEREGQAVTLPEEPTGNRVEAAAYQAPDGTVYYGPSHLDAMGKALDAGKIEQAEIDAKQETTARETPEFGFATNADPFVSRDQAETIARQSGQITVEQPATGKLHSNEVSLDAFAQPVAPEAAPAAVEPPPVAPPPAIPQLEPLRRVARAEQTEEDVAGLVDSGFVELYNGQPVITQAGLEALPETERPRLTPEARKIQIDTRTSEAAAEAISKNLRIGVDQVPVDVRMPAGWTLVGDVYIPPTKMAKIETFDVEALSEVDEDSDVFADVIKRKDEAKAAVVQKPEGSAFATQDEFRAAFDLRGEGHGRFATRLDLMVADGVITSDGRDLIMAVIYDNNTDDVFLKNMEMGSFRNRVTSAYGRGGVSRQTVESAKGKAIGVKPSLRMIRNARRDLDIDARTAQTLSTFWHEFGHAGYYSLLDKAQKDKIASIYRKTTKAQREKFFGEGVAAARQETVTARYYAKSETEWFAQSFAEYVLTKKSDQKGLVPIFESILTKIKGVFGKLFSRKDGTPELEDIFEYIIQGKDYGTTKIWWNGMQMSLSPALYGVGGAQPVDPQFSKRLLEREKQNRAKARKSITAPEAIAEEPAAVGEIPPTAEEPIPAPTFTEGTPESATLKAMEASMAKVDAASEAKGGKPETQKISDIAANWMDQGGDERALQDAIVENTNLTPANAARVAKAINKQYGLQQQIAETGAVIAEITPEPEGAPRKSAVTKLIEQNTGVRKPVVKLQVSESAALKKQIQLKAREARETRKARKEAAEELAKSITDYVKANPIRGPINSRQAMSITKKALKLDVNNEAAVDRFEMYVERVIENANYDRDLADARALIKRAKAFAKAKGTEGNVKVTLEAIANVAPTLLNNPFEFNLVVQRYLLGLAPVTAKQYAVMPDADVRRYLESLETQIKDNQEVLDRSKAQRILDKQAAYAEEKGIPLDEAIAILNSEEFLQEKTIEKLEDLTKLLTSMAQESQKDVKAYDDSGATPKQKELISFMRKVNLESLINEEKKRYIRFANNLLANGATFGMEQFQSIALGQEAAMKAAKDKRLSNKLAAWISPIGGDKAIDTARRIALRTQSEADTFKNIFGREAVGAFRNILGLNRLDVAQTDSNRAKEQIANEFGEYFKGLRKKYGDDATNFEAKGYAGIAGYLIQTDGNKTEAESIPYRRRLMEQNIVELRKSDKQADLAEADLKERALAQLTGTTNAEILSQLRALNPASYEQLMWVKDVMLPKWRDFLKEHDENFRNQANNYNNPDHLTITYKFPEGQLLPSEMEDVYQQDMIGMRIKQAANSIKRKDHPNLPVSKAGTIANIDINFGYNQYNALVDQVDKAFVAPAWEQVVAFTKAPEFEQVMGGRANALFVKNLLRDIQTSRSRQSLTDDEAQLIAGGVRLARKISTQAVLGGITQPLRQVPDQLAKLFFTTGRFDLITKNLLTTAQAAPLLNKFPIGRRGDAQAGTQYASQFNELARKVEASVTDRKWAQYRELMNKVGEFWMTPLRGSDVWAAKVSWMSYYEAELNKKGIKMESWEREAELVDTDQDRKEAASYAEFAVDFYGGASDPTKMAALSKQSNNGWKEFAKLVFLPLNSFALQQKNSLISDLRDAYLRTGDRKASIAAIAGTLAGMAAFHGMRIYIIGGLIYPAGKALLMGIFGIDMDEPDEEEKQKQLEDNWRKFKASMYGNIIAGGAGEFAEKAAIDAVNRTAYLWDANINPDSLLNDKGEIMSFRQYEKEVSPLYRFRSYGSSEYSFGLADVLTEQATHALAETQQLMTPEEMEKYTGNEQAYAAFATGIEWMYFFRLMDTDVKRIATDLKRQMDKEVTERESELKRIREGR